MKKKLYNYFNNIGTKILDKGIKFSRSFLLVIIMITLAFISNSRKLISIKRNLKHVIIITSKLLDIC